MKKEILRFTLLVAITVGFFTTACQNKSSNENGGTPPARVATTATPTPDASVSPSTSATLPPLPEKFANVTFTDVTAQAGIRFKHNNGAFGKKYLPETNGSGCAFLDYDNDGWQDVLLINSTSFPHPPKKGPSPIALHHH